MRWLVTGSTGMLGTDLVEMLRSADEQVDAPTRAELDLSDLAAVSESVPGHDMVVNCAAWTAVDAAEEHESQALTLNAVVPDLLARACASSKARMVQLSTDYVFDGTATTPYAENARTRPASAYGRTKAAGEEAVRTALPHAHWVLRTSWLYGAHGSCFPRTIAEAAHEQGEVRVVTDQVGAPTWTVDVAALLMRLVDADAPAGVYHATASGQCSWFEFARAVVSSAGLPSEVVVETTSDAFPRPAPRPAYSVLGHKSLERLGVEPIGPWRDRWDEAAPTVLAATSASQDSRPSR
ncbi:MAG TPA: dTDP-4-dehydrorhamnose reductase [Nocardioidaceae bacterium]|nr:dTDP-4-dehydrorhamnose reductase [Nocardioidaceae bacterium]